MSQPTPARARRRACEMLRAIITGAMIGMTTLGTCVHAQTTGTPPQGTTAPGRALSLLEMRDAAFGGDPARQRLLAFSELPADASIATIDLYSG